MSQTCPGMGEEQVLGETVAGVATPAAIVEVPPHFARATAEIIDPVNPASATSGLSAGR